MRLMVASAPTLLAIKVDASSRLRPLHASQLACHKRFTPSATSPEGFARFAGFAGFAGCVGFARCVVFVSFEHHASSKRRLTLEIGVSNGSLRENATSRPALRQTLTTPPGLLEFPRSLVFDGCGPRPMTVESTFATTETSAARGSARVRRGR